MIQRGLSATGATTKVEAKPALSPVGWKGLFCGLLIFLFFIAFKSP